jgi:hypothetical protein
MGDQQLLFLIGDVKGRYPVNDAFFPGRTTMVPNFGE